MLSMTKIIEGSTHKLMIFILTVVGDHIESIIKLNTRYSVQLLTSGDHAAVLPRPRKMAEVN